MGKFYDAETNSYIGMKNSSIGEKKCERHEKLVNDPNLKKKKTILTLLLSGTIVAAVGGLTLPDAVQNQNIYEALYGKYGKIVKENTYTVIDVNNTYTAYKNDSIAIAMSQCKDIPNDDLIFLVYDAYHYYPSDQMDQIIKKLSNISGEYATSLSNYLGKFNSFEEYYKSLGFKNEKEYKNEMKSRVIATAKAMAIQNENNNTKGIISYDYDSNTFEVNSNGGRNNG